jgi:hypothetical protein
MTASSSFTVDVKDNSYAYIFTTKKDPKFYVGGFEGGFELIDTLSINGTTYYKYKSENHSLGSILIEIK